jgi:hypothetical protein
VQPAYDAWESSEQQPMSRPPGTMGTFLIALAAGVLAWLLSSLLSSLVNLK